MNPLVKLFWKYIAKQNAKREALLKRAENVCDITDIAYIDDGSKYHLLDIYRPEGNDEKLPVIIDIHGGGWYHGDKELNKPYCRLLVKYGFAVVNISYTLAEDTDLKGQLKDCFRAIDYVYKNADKYKLDVSNMFLTGDSAGGHLIGLILNILNDENLQEFFGVKTEAYFRAACFTCPCLEVRKLAKRAGFGAYFNNILGKGYRKSELFKHVDFYDDLTDKICPCFFITLRDDMLKAQTVTGYEKLSAMGVECDIYCIEEPSDKNFKIDHVANILYPDRPESREANSKMCAFFKKHIV